MTNGEEIRRQVSATALARHGFTVPLLIAGLAALVALLYMESFDAMTRAWGYSTYRHCVVVFPVSAYLLWRLRRDLAVADLRPWPLGIALLVALVAMWLVSRVVGVQTAEHLAIVLLIPAMVATCLGRSLAKTALFPLLFLIVAVPVGEELIPHLMLITADISAGLLRLVGVPVFRAGQFMSLPGGEFEVADVCSGLRYLIAGTMIALLFAYFTYRKTWKRVAFVVGAALCLIVANGIRAFVVMFVASTTHMRLFAGLDHVIFGWVLFGVVIGLVLSAGARYGDAAPAAKHDSSNAPSARARQLPLVLVLGVVMLGLTAQPIWAGTGSLWMLLPGAVLLLWSVSSPVVAGWNSADAAPRGAGFSGAPSRSALVIVLATAVLASGPVLVGRIAPVGTVADAVELPEIGSCGAPKPWAEKWQPQLQQPDVSAEGSYGCAGGTVNVLFARYVSNTQGRELITSDNRLIPQAWQRFSENGSNRFEASNGRSVEVREISAEVDGRSTLIWYWYAIGERTATAPTRVKLLQAFEVLVHGRSDGALYMLETADGESPGQAARERMATVARALSLHLAAEPRTATLRE